jgi:flagellar protein FliO/FliZ
MGSPGIGTLLSALGSLLAIFSVLIAATFALRRLRSTQWGQRPANPAAIKLIATRPLGGQNTLVIAEVANQRFLIGISRTSISAIGKLDGDE